MHRLRRVVFGGQSRSRLREIAKRISAGKTMPLMLLDGEGYLVGKARELSYRPETPRQRPTKPPPFIGGENQSSSEI